MGMHWPRLVGWGMLVAGLAVMAGAGWLALRYRNIIETWPVVNAEILERKVAPYSYTVRGGMRTRDAFKVEARMRYSSQDREFVQAWPEVYSFADYSDALRKSEEFRRGAVKRIQYNPADPSEARIEARYDAQTFVVPFAVGAAGLLCASLGFLFTRVELSSRPSVCACGQRLGHNYDFCPGCAAPLHEEAKEWKDAGLPCPGCGEPVPRGYDKCLNCMEVLPTGGAKSEKGKRHCAWCAKRVAKNHKYCHSCSAPLSAA